MSYRTLRSTSSCQPTALQERKHHSKPIQPSVEETAYCRGGGGFTATTQVPAEFQRPDVLRPPVLL
ncbi:MAG: hypothetical protein DME96_07965 [Verrucomicrobia bacterium]|nr:MAG: hypothetical protein DME96_07965 [Verrucomicrobiota bacterium]